MSTIREASAFFSFEQFPEEAEQARHNLGCMLQLQAEHALPVKSVELLKESADCFRTVIAQFPQSVSARALAFVLNSMAVGLIALGEAAAGENALQEAIEVSEAALSHVSRTNNTHLWGALNNQFARAQMLHGLFRIINSSKRAMRDWKTSVERNLSNSERALHESLNCGNAEVVSAAQYHLVALKGVTDLFDKATSARGGESKVR